MDYPTVSNPEYWQQLLPDLTVSIAGHDRTFEPLDLSTGDKERENLSSEGYLQYDEVLDSKLVASLRDGVTTLVKSDWLPVFAFMYDEFWDLSFQFNKLLRFALGDDVKMMPDFWSWYVDHETQSSGWGPHRDKVYNTLLPDGMPKSATLWIPLTDATPENGCMYILPADRDGDYQNFTRSRPPDIDLQAIRALPAKAGSVLLWNQRIFHWGARSSRHARGSRISVAFEFQRGDVPAYNQPLLKADRRPAFELRLKLIGKQILQYTHMYGYSDDLVALANAMVGEDHRFRKKA